MCYGKINLYNQERNKGLMLNRLIVLTCKVSTEVERINSPWIYPACGQILRPGCTRMQFELRVLRCFPSTSACTSIDVSTSRDKYLIEIFNLCVCYSAVIEELKSLHLRLNGEITGKLQVTWKSAAIYLLLRALNEVYTL